jgi:hypothetical protein
MVMDGVAQRRWTARRQLDGEGRCDDDSTTMDDKEGASAHQKPEYCCL